MNTDFLKIKFETEDEFEKIADKLMNTYAIQNEDSIYRLIEVEFYWTSPTHKDFSTYKRRHIDPENGEWFFHYSGVDIALKNEKTGGFGGILIRAIYSQKEKKVFKGPQVCAMKLFSGTCVFTESIKTKLIESDYEKEKVHKATRIGLGANAKLSHTDSLTYNFSISIK